MARLVIAWLTPSARQAARMAKIPAFSLEGSDGARHSAKEFAGKRWILYFYPRDNTPGCTVQACGFRDAGRQLADEGVPVVGVSPDSVKSHLGFIAKQQLNFLLLSDPDHTLAEKLGVWGEKTLYGKKHLGIIRSTFLIDADGTILREWRGVRVAGHVDEVIVEALA